MSSSMMSIFSFSVISLILLNLLCIKFPMINISTTIVTQHIPNIITLAVLLYSSSRSQSFKINFEILKKQLLISSRPEVSPLCRWTRWCGGCNTGAPGGSVEMPGHLCILSGREGNSRNPPDGSRLGQEQSPTARQASQSGWNWSQNQLRNPMAKLNQNPNLMSENMNFTWQCELRPKIVPFCLNWCCGDELVIIGLSVGLTWTWRPGLHCELWLFPDSLCWLTEYLNTEY